MIWINKNPNISYTINSVQKWNGIIRFKEPKRKKLVFKFPNCWFNSLLLNINRININNPKPRDLT